jgi:hypothetical protein
MKPESIIIFATWMVFVPCVIEAMRGEGRK